MAFTNFKTEEEEINYVAELRRKYGDEFIQEMVRALERLVKDSEASQERRRRREAKRLAGGDGPKTRVRKKTEPTASPETQPLLPGL